MREKVMDYARKIYGTKMPKKVLKRLDYEFKIIEECNLANDLIYLSFIINKWKNKGYFVNGLGNLKESLVAYLLGIIDVNPIRLNKIFFLDFKEKTFKILVPKEIKEKLENDLKKIDIKINYLNWFQVDLLSELENKCNLTTSNISFDDVETREVFVKKDKIGHTLTIFDSLEINYGTEFAFGINNIDLKTFYDYINYDKYYNNEYSTGLVIAYYITYYKVHFPNLFYQIYIDKLIEFLASDTRTNQTLKMQYLKIKIIDIYNNGYKLTNI